MIKIHRTCLAEQKEKEQVTGVGNLFQTSPEAKGVCICSVPDFVKSTPPLVFSYKCVFA